MSYKTDQFLVSKKLLVHGKLKCGNKRVTQKYSVTNTVYINSTSGIISTYTNQIEQGQTYTFTVHNKHVDKNSVVLLTGFLTGQNYFVPYVSNIRKHKFDINYFFVALPGIIPSISIDLSFLIC